MRIVERVLSWLRKSSSLDVLLSLMAGRQTKTGRTVNSASAREVTTVFACARVIANGIAQVPLQLFRMSQDGRVSLPAVDDPLYRVLYRRPNAWQTSFEFRQMLGFHLVLCGNAFCVKSRGLDGEIAELIPFEPGHVTVKRDRDGDLTYDVRGAETGSVRTIPPEDIWHVKGPSWNSWMGLEVVALAREAIGLAMAAEESQALLHKNGLRTTGTYSVEGTLTAQQHKDLREWIEHEMSGSGNVWKPLILDHSAKWIPDTVKGVDAQHVETRRFQIEEICRAFGVLPIMVGHSDKATTYASAEAMFAAHLQITMAPWYECLEHSIDEHLLTERQRRDGLYSSFAEEELLRASVKETGDYLVQMVINGILTRNEARRYLDRNPLEGLDEPLTPANIVVGARPTA